MKTNGIKLRGGIALAIGVLALSCDGAHSAADLWTDDFEAAKATAAKEKKDLLMDFTGSDWCGFCIELHENVFDTAEFKKEGPKHFVLVELDFPKKKELPDKLKQQNEKLGEQFGIEGFPTIFLTDSSGRPYARTGYMEGGPKEYLAHLMELRDIRIQRDEQFAKAAKASGLEKAKGLAKGLKAMDEELVRSHYASVVEEIISADPDDTLGFKKRLEFDKKDVELRTKLGELAEEKKFDEFLKTVDAFIAAEKLEGEFKQRVLLYKASVYGPGKLNEIEKVADEVIKIGGENMAVEHARKLKEQVAEVRSQISKSKGEDADEEEPEEKPDGEKQPPKKDKPKKPADDEQ